MQKRNSIGISSFLLWKKIKRSHLCIEEFCDKVHVDSLLIEEKVKKHYVFIKDFNTLIYDDTPYIIKQSKTVEKTFLLLLFTNF